MKNLIRGIAVLLTAVFLCFNIYYELAPGITVAPEQKFMFAAIFAVLLRAALFCGVPDNTRPTRRRLYMLVLFLYYIWVLLNVLFFDNAFGRGFGHTSLDMVNLEPLRTVKNYLLAYGYGNISLRLVVLNLAGNLIAFAPMGVFLPALFRWQRSIFFFTASLTLSITAVEVLQVYTGTARAMWMILSSIWQVRCLCSLSAGLRRCGTGFAVSIQDRRNDEMTTGCKGSRFFIDKPCLPL